MLAVFLSTFYFCKKSFGKMSNNVSMMLLKGEVVVIKIKALGKFSLSDGVNLLNDDVLRSDMLKKLLIYILIHRERLVHTQELLDVLWAENEPENPMGALKNLMYRLRNTLKTFFGDFQFILTGSGAYRWNPQIEVVLDIEEFEHYIKSARQEKNPFLAMEQYENALQLYDGDFLDNALTEHWAVIMVTHYHSLFLSSTKELADLYMHMGQYRDMERICMQGLRFDHTDEKLHCNYILSFIKQNKTELAMKSFDDATKILYETLGIRNSDELGKVQKELLKMNMGNVQKCMKTIYDDMTEEENPAGVYMCGYPVFREICRLETRKNARFQEVDYLVLLTMELKQNTKTENDKMERFIIKQAMKQLEDSLKETLKMGDVVTRYSDRQLVILLFTCSYENSVAVTKRILSKFYEKNKTGKVAIKFEFEQMIGTPATSMM